MRRHISVLGLEGKVLAVSPVNSQRGARRSSVWQDFTSLAMLSCREVDTVSKIQAHRFPALHNIVEGEEKAEAELSETKPPW
eukprot:3406701-Rhodomonas_salina.1